MRRLDEHKAEAASHAVPPEEPEVAAARASKQGRSATEKRDEFAPASLIEWHPIPQ
jgi:hypothetical protein